jgi:hypothetical protein
MSWQDIMRRVLPPAGGVSPHITSAYGATNRPPGSTNPHRGVDFNYDVGPNGQRGINLQHPALRAPVDGVVENAGEGNVGRIAIRDKNGFLHQILHTYTRHVAIGDPVVAAIFAAPGRQCGEWIWQRIGHGKYACARIVRRVIGSIAASHGHANRAASRPAHRR